MLFLMGSISFSETAAVSVKIINHRGYNTVAPENTLPAFELSAEKGYTFVETDVCFTKDFVPVLLHDPIINHTARNGDGSGILSVTGISDLTYEEVLSYDFGIWKGEEYAGIKIPTFGAFLSLCGERGLHPYIELKENGKYRQEQIAGLVDMVRERGMQNGVTWISLNAEYLKWVRDQDPDARLGWLVAVWFSQDQFRSILRKITELRTGSNEVFLDANIFMLLLSPGGSDWCIDMCRAAGIPLEIWTLDSEAVKNQLDPYITGITTNSILPGK